MLSPTHYICANEQQVAAKVMDGEAIIINLGTGIYYSLGTTGAFIWSLIEKRPSIRDVIRNVVEQYEVGEAEATSDVLRLSAELCAEGLAVASIEGVAVPIEPQAGLQRQRYEAPTIEKFTDMAEMFALDPPLPGLSQGTTS